MDELVNPLDRHILHRDRASLLSLVGRRVRRPAGTSSRVKRDPDGGRNRVAGEDHSLQRHQGLCGHQSRTFDPPLASSYILNGSCSPYGSFPWVVQIQVLENGRYQHRCGGSLISSTHVLTARHCFDGRVKPRHVMVIVGQNNMDVRDSSEMSFEVERFWLYEDFQTAGPYSHDIALVKLRRKANGRGVVFSRWVSPICLPTSSTVLQPNLKCTVSGWGRIHGKESRTSVGLY